MGPENFGFESCPRLPKRYIAQGRSVRPFFPVLIHPSHFHPYIIYVILLLFLNINYVISIGACSTFLPHPIHGIRISLSKLLKCVIDRRISSEIWPTYWMLTDRSSNEAKVACLRSNSFYTNSYSWTKHSLAETFRPVRSVTCTPKRLRRQLTYLYYIRCSSFTLEFPLNQA